MPDRPDELRYLMSPDQHRRQAERLRGTGEPKLMRLAQDHDNLARVIEARIAEAERARLADSKIQDAG